MTASSLEFLKSGRTIIDLLNYALEDQSLLEQLLLENSAQLVSTKAPGLVVQAYLLLARKVGFNVFGPLDGTISETVNNCKNQGDVKTELIEVSTEEESNMWVPNAPHPAPTLYQTKTINVSSFTILPTDPELPGPSSSPVVEPPTKKKKVFEKQDPLNGYFPCELCDKVFTIRSYRTDHQKEEHADLTEFACREQNCNKVYPELSKLKTHMRESHSNREYECDNCGEKFKHSRSYYRHKQTSHKEPEHKCPQCNKEAVAKSLQPYSSFEFYPIRVKVLIFVKSLLTLNRHSP